jgi:hypothetical protein
MRTRVGVVLVLLLGVLAGCRQAPLEPDFAEPAADRAVPPTPAVVQFTPPTGFIEAYDYHPGHLYFPAPTVEFLVPSDAVDSFDNLEVISVISYVMNIDVTEWPEERLAGLVKRMVGELGSSVAEPEQTAVAGHTAYTLPVVEKSADGATTYTYQATFIFDGTHLVQTQCQYQLRQELVEQACAELHSSMQITIT